MLLNGILPHSDIQAKMSSSSMIPESTKFVVVVIAVESRMTVGQQPMAGPQQHNAPHGRDLGFTLSRNRAPGTTSNDELSS